MGFDFNNFVQSSVRIFNVSRKPGIPEYKVMVKITGLGILIIGFIGFFVRLVLDGFFKL